ncbi:substrate-binding domain-containing protein [Streptomyces sp. M19]
MQQRRERRGGGRLPGAVRGAAGAGVLVTPADSTGRNLAAFRRNAIPFVLVDRVLSGAEEGCSVSVDDVTGGTMAVRHLLSLGHRSVTYVSGPAHLPQCRDRYAGRGRPWRRRACRRGPWSAWWPTASTSPRVWTRGPAAGQDHPPAAVFCANDLLALGVLQAMYAAGVAVPRRSPSSATTTSSSPRRRRCR